MGRTITPQPGTYKETIRGVIQIPGATNSQAATIAAVNPSKSKLRLEGVRAIGSITATDWPLLELTNSTTITAIRHNNSSGLAVQVGWELDIYY